MYALINRWNHKDLICELSILSVNWTHLGTIRNASNLDFGELSAFSIWIEKLILCALKGEVNTNFSLVFLPLIVPINSLRRSFWFPEVLLTWTWVMWWPLYTRLSHTVLLLLCLTPFLWAGNAVCEIDWWAPSSHHPSENPKALW